MGIIESLEKRSLITPERGRDFALLAPRRELFSLRDELFAVLDAEDRERVVKPGDPLGFYSFMASRVVRGDDCSSPDCRREKARVIARYSALYADKLYVPIWIPHSDDEDRVREIMHGTIVSVLEMRVPIESGLLVPTSHEPGYCSNCMTNHVPRHSELLRAARDFMDSEAGNLEFYLQRDNDNAAALDVYGPEDILPHGSMVMRVDEDRYQWVNAANGKAVRGRGILLPPEFVREHHIADLVFDDFEEDAVLQNYNRARLGCKYLASVRGETEVFARLGRNDASASQRQILTAKLAHHLPILRELPLATLIRIREGESDSFALYRSALERVIKEASAKARDVTAENAEQIFEDELRQPVLKLRAKLNAATRQSRRSRIRKIIGSAAVAVSVGLASPMVPEQFRKLFYSVPGCAYLRDFVGAAVDNLEIPAEVRSDESYFLLRAAQELEELQQFQ